MVGGVEDIVSRELSRGPEPAWRVEVCRFGLVYEGGEEVAKWVYNREQWDGFSESDQLSAGDFMLGARCGSRFFLCSCGC